MPGLTGVNHITLTVTDLDRSRRWYESVLGLRILNHEEVGEFRMVVLGDPMSGTVLALTQHAGRGEGRFDERRPGLDHLSFTVAGKDQLREWGAHLERMGVDHSPMAEDPFGLVLVFRDPDDIQLELFAPMRPGATTGGAVLSDEPGEPAGSSPPR